jgi:hypothetical protein
MVFETLEQLEQEVQAVRNFADQLEDLLKSKRREEEQRSGTMPEVTHRITHRCDTVH